MHATMQADPQPRYELHNCESNEFSGDLRYAQPRARSSQVLDLTGADLRYATDDPATIFPSGQDFTVSPWGIPGGLPPWAAVAIPVPGAERFGNERGRHRSGSWHSAKPSTQLG